MTLSAVIKLEALLGVVAFALWVFCLVDAIGSPAARVRNLPKVAWIVLILFFPFVGSIAWLVAGRPESRAAAIDPEKDDVFLRQVRQRAEEQRKRYEADRRRARESDE